MNSFGLHRGRGNTQSAKEAPLVRSRGLRAPCQRQRERTERRRERNHQGHRRQGHRRKGSVEAQRRSASAPPTRDASRKRRACESAQTAAAPTGGSQTTLRVAASQELVRTLPSLASQDWMIGDTGKDIQVGQMLGIKTCAVLSGFLNEKALLNYGPDLILPTAADFRP